MFSIHVSGEAGRNLCCNDTFVYNGDNMNTARRVRAIEINESSNSLGVGIEEARVCDALMFDLIEHKAQVVIGNTDYAQLRQEVFAQLLRLFL